MEVVGVQSNPYSTNQLLDRYMTNWNTSLVDLFTEMELEDPDLMATYQDWLLVYNHFTDNGLHRPKASYFDVENLDFMSIAIEFLKHSFAMLIELRMDIDPDDSPWLSHLSPRQKEERRRLFWQLYKQYSFELSYLPDPLDFFLVGDKVKPIGQVFDPFPVFEDEGYSYPLISKLEAELWNVIGTIRGHFALPPQSVQYLLNAPNPHHDRLHSVLASIPLEYRFLFEDSTKVTIDDESRFITQISQVQGHLYHINFNLYSSVCVFNRPLVFLTALPSYRPMYLSSTHQSKILTAILKTNDAAWRITSLMLFFEKLEFNETSRGRIPEAEQVYYCIHRDTLSFFEAFISLWFLNVSYGCAVAVFGGD
ncbi:hypothetical protein HDU79_010628 [Rhizoclosmatium sp. JEL0117]|nr:hypothetical protein HDU79_010628 [Rhizoclosmatium sp. JEL0117]